MKKKYTLDMLCRLIDHTNLKADASHHALKILCKEATQYHFKMVAINQVQSEICANLLAKTDINIGAAIAFPLGQTSIAAKVFETKNAINMGANEIDYVINITELKEKNYDHIEQEMRQIVAVCRENKVISKVIFENCYLTKDEITKLCEIALRVKPNYIKTSTGFGPSGAKIEDVKLMKQCVGHHIKVKAAGGIRDAETFKSMIEAGAERIGTSAGIKIIEELSKKFTSSNTFIEI